MDFSNLFMSTEGRIGRQNLWIGLIILAVIGIVIIQVIWFLFDHTSFMARLLNLVYTLAVAYPAYAVLAKRFQDRGKKGMFAGILIGLSILSALLALFGLTGDPLNPNTLGTALGFVMGIVGLWYLIELGFLRGTIGANEYGPDPVG
jgi:uncharacterized membrane protein YhaH (DUF805 family)